LGTCCAGIFISSRTYISSKNITPQETFHPYKSIITALQSRIKCINRRMRWISLSSFSLGLFPSFLPHQISERHHLLIITGLLLLFPVLVVSKTF
jgi:hypothetical protein